MTAALEEGEWLAARPCRTLAPRKTRYPFYRRLGGSQARSGRAENLFTTAIPSRNVQAVVSRYTNWATGPTQTTYYSILMCQKGLVLVLICLVDGILTIVMQFQSLHITDSQTLHKYQLDTLSNLLTYPTVQSPSWAANWFAASQEIPRISRSPKVRYRTHKCPPPVSILGQANPVLIPTSHLLEIHLNIIRPSTPKNTVSA